MSSSRSLTSQVRTLAEIVGGKPENIVSIATEDTFGSGSAGGDAKSIAPVGVDYSRIDYAAYDLLYHGRLAGYELGGLMVRVIIDHTADFILDRQILVQVDEPREEAEASEQPEVPPNPTGMTLQAPDVKKVESHTNQVLRAWSRRYTSFIKTIVVDTLKFGDMFVVVNDDGTMTAIPPNNVQKVVNPYNGKIEAYQIFSIVTEQIGTQQVRVIYRETHSIEQIITEWKPLAARDIPSNWRIATHIEGAVRPNSLGILDVIHFHNNKRDYELYGYSEVYSMLTILRRYDDLLNWAITGNKLMGRPSPVFQGIKNIKEFERMYGRAVTTTAGQKQTIIDWKPEQVIVLGDGAEFRLASPQPFASDTKTILSLLFWIIAQHSKVPEFIWGTAVNSNKASVQEQLVPFIKHIETKRQQFEGFASDPLLELGPDGGIHQLVYVWLRKRQLLDRSINIDLPTIVNWPNISSKESEMVRRIVEWLFSQGLITEETSLQITNSLMGDPINDIMEELFNARLQARERQQRSIQAQIDRGTNTPFGTEEDGSPAAGPTTADGTESGIETDNPGDNQFTGQEE